jgi:hypothetical protein
MTPEVVVTRSCQVKVNQKLHSSEAEFNLKILMTMKQQNLPEEHSILYNDYHLYGKFRRGRRNLLQDRYPHDNDVCTIVLSLFS